LVKIWWSILSHVKAAVAGLKVPWAKVKSLFVVTDRTPDG
jgi:hypothetical protein